MFPDVDVILIAIAVVPEDFQDAVSLCFFLIAAGNQRERSPFKS